MTLRGGKDDAATFKQPFLRKGKRPPPEPELRVPPIVYDPNNPALTLTEIQHAKEIITNQHSRIDELSKEVTELRTGLDDEVATSRQVAGFLERELGIKDRKTRALGTEIEDKAKERDRAVARMQKELQQQLREQQAAYDATELAMRREVAELKEENKQLLHFRAQQQE